MNGLVTSRRKMVISPYCSGAEAMDFLGIIAHVCMLPEVVACTYCNGVETTDVRGMKVLVCMLQAIAI